MTRVGIRDVAAAAGVSMGTVSHFLNHPARVSDTKAKRIQEAIEALGFVRNNAGRQLRLGQSSTIAYIAPDVSNPFFAMIAEGAERRAAELGLSLFLANSGGETSREDAYLELFEEHGVRGMLVASHGSIEDRLASVRSRGTPTVLVGRHAAAETQPSVSIDEVLGGRLAVEHLLALGRRRLAFVGGPLSIQQVGERLSGASRAVAAVPGATLEMIDVQHRVIAEGHEVGEAIADREPAARPDAIFAVNDLLAIGLEQVLIGRGIRVPEDIALIGYDDIEYAEASIVPLSSIRAPQESFGASAVDLLQEVVSAEGDGVVDRRRVFAPELVERASTRGR
ncbi:MULTISPECIES: LacI family DNA-binding transcriptional regulator [Rathayibacter]|uniref:LacI family transcriptional regulator n=1 Tax=Rathayibacter festucae DSM 15932 TaxID=1328866 RepID=A0A3T0T5N2_9MICO|nr:MULTISPECIES: substrate-binding domain-containing protein [Rathayibacter]AZZ53913.1 LacI family transcriptional regulator [Rathayibacter festucae DSM 15932]ROQ15561.1 LacI family transcriptional regulator [Rathayibacter sp. PhB93]TCL85619.1 LacI family transcriptional regulator [Rathayibacter sp. PhB192]TCM31440.1 LacI family transcriptional regulator [Rathayibacter sp. PhB179]TDQ15499.1 LacI family transcriptional regulator [Rathayibacter sp. PhB1]